MLPVIVVYLYVVLYLVLCTANNGYNTELARVTLCTGNTVNRETYSPFTINVKFCTVLRSKRLDD